jgi:hypothetical protein
MWPVAEPTDPATQQNTDYALQESGLIPVPAGQSMDHVNTIPDALGGTGDNCGLSGGSGSLPSMPFATNPEEPIGSTPYQTTPWQSCGPSFAMQSGGMMPGGSSGGSAEPLVSAETDPSTWQSFMGYGWPGDPALDWPEIIPPEGWDPSQAYGDPYAAPHGSTSGYAKGGIRFMQEGGVTGGETPWNMGGLNSYQLQAGLDAGNQILGSIYAYEWADPAVGFDCSGTWQWIYQAVAEGGSVPGPRYLGTYAWESGVGDMVPGNQPGAMNIGVDTGGVGQGAMSEDGTHMSGDIMGSSFESTVPSGVHGGLDATAYGTQWTLGDPATMASSLPSGPGYDPSGNIQSEVADWWTCQTQPYQSYDPNYPINPWDSQLPGMTETYLQDVGQGTLGGLGYGGSPSGTSLQDWIVAALNAVGMDASPEAIASLEALANCESGGDPTAMNSEGSGASGIMQMMPETFDAYSIGGDIMDPVSNIAASINYQMGRYGHLVSACPYKDGGMALGPHFGVMGEAGREMMLPLDNKKVMSNFRNEVLGGGAMNADVVARLDMVASEIRGLPGPVGEAVGGGMQRRLSRHAPTQRAVQSGINQRSKRQYFAGVRR